MDSEPDFSTAFSVVSKQFPAEGDKIKTLDLLDATKELVAMIENFGRVFSPVVYDMTQNIKKLSKKYEQDVKAHEYIQDMILLQKPEDEVNATDALLWLRRALQFLSLFFDGVIREFDENVASNDLSTLVKKVYTQTLEPHHGWLGTQLFKVLSKFAPTRDSLLHKLALEKPDRHQQVIADMKKYNSKMLHCVQVLTNFYSVNDLAE